MLSVFGKVTVSLFVTMQVQPGAQSQYRYEKHGSQRHGKLLAPFFA